MIFVRDQVLECVSPTPGLTRGALYICEGVERPRLFGWNSAVCVREAATGKLLVDKAGEPIGYWAFRFKAARYQLAPVPPAGAPITRTDVP